MRHLKLVLQVTVDVIGDPEKIREDHYREISLASNLHRNFDGFQIHRIATKVVEDMEVQ